MKTIIEGLQSKYKPIIFIFLNPESSFNKSHKITESILKTWDFPPLVEGKSQVSQH